jgi:hypothetical protein
MAEFARVLRPGGHLVVSDVHHEWVALGSVPHVRRDDDAAPGLLPAHRHRIADYLGAALRVGLQVRGCDEVVAGGDGDPWPPPATTQVGPWDEWPWTLLRRVPQVTRTLQRTTPQLVVWHFQR